MRQMLNDRGRQVLRLWGVALMALALASTAAADQIKLTIIGPGSNLAPIAISQLKNLGGDDDGTVSGQFVHTLTRDLKLSGYFRMVDPHAYIEKPQESGYTLGQFNFADWSSINAQFLVKGSVSASDQQVTI